MKRMVWLVVSYLMVLSLVLASCAPKVTEEKDVVTEKKEVVTEKKEVVVEKEVVAEQPGKIRDVLGRLVKEPRYGGIFNFSDFEDPRWGVDYNSYLAGSSKWYMLTTHESLAVGDRLKGPLGSGEWAFLYVGALPDMLTGNLAESWEIIPPDTIKLKIRRGVRWQDKWPTYGREFTAEDVVYNFVMRYEIPGSRWPVDQPLFSQPDKVHERVYIDPKDPWTVVWVTDSIAGLGNSFETIISREAMIPKELGMKPDENWRTWGNLSGTGAFIITDYVKGSQLTFARNPNYWGKDVFHPQNQLPYIDGMKVFIVPDLSTQQAALRTGKLDALPQAELEDARSLWRTTPELKAVEDWGPHPAMFMRHDVKPWDNVKVRQAMMMAIDHDAMVRDLYYGEAEKFYYPVFAVPEHKPMRIPLEELPEVAQQMYGYYPDKAKRILAEEGYPNGFTTSILVSRPQDIDLLSIVKYYWEKVGVTLVLDVRDDAVKRSMEAAFSYKDGTFGTFDPSQMIRHSRTRMGARSNYVKANNPLIEKQIREISDNYFDWGAITRIVREAVPEIVLWSPFIMLPVPKVYHMYQPWVKNFNHEKTTVGNGHMSGAYFLWIDQDLKKAMRR